MADTYTTEAIACGLSDVAGWLENEGGRDKHARTIRLGVERLRELGAASQPVIVGWHSIAKLAAEGEVHFDESPVVLIAASDLYGNDIAALRAPVAPSHPGEADRVGLGELERLSDEATTGEMVAIPYSDGEGGCHLNVDGMQIAAGLPDEDGAYIAALWNAHRAGHLVPASLAALGTGEGSGGASPISKRIIYCGQPAAVVCDARCNKAWGISSRPKITFGDDPDDCAYLADGELGEAPADPGTYEGGHGKPVDPSERLNKWCVRECERSAMSRAGRADEVVEAPDFSRRSYNQPWLHPEALGTEAGTAETQSGSVHEGPADLSATPSPLPHPQAPNTLSEVEKGDAALSKLAAAIDAADHGYSITLTALSNEGSVYTLDLCDGSELLTFGDRDDAAEHALRHRSLARARAALATLRASKEQDGEVSDV